MENVNGRPVRFYPPYALMLAVYLGFFIFAFTLDTPAGIFNGLLKILVSRSILVTDYIALGGIGATLLNSAIVGSASVLRLSFSGIKPNGAIIMALWLTAGFAFFGKNLFNMIPLTCGVWLCAKHKKEPFSNYSLASLLVATLSPTVSEIGFLGFFSRPVEILLGILMGFLIGFIFPAVSAGTVRVHGGYDLYNMGFAGGLISTVAVSVLKSVGIDIFPSDIWSSGNNFILAAFLYAISAVMLCFGLFHGNARENLAGFRGILKHSGRLVTDFYFMYGNSVYINMALLGAVSTTLVLMLGANLNGPAVAGIFTIIGFGSFGKHLKNVIPVLIGAVISAYVNKWDPSFPTNIVAILFSTGLAPIAGQFGWGWGIVAGFLHVNIAMHIGYLNSGLNLYNNGFAAGFVAMFLLPIITLFGKDKNNER